MILAVDQVDKFVQLTFQGIAVGARYALVALGFVIIFKATHVINFAQGSFVVLGAYLAFNFRVTWDLPFPLAAALAAVSVGLFAMVFERLVVRRMVGKPSFSIIMITIGLLIVINQVITRVWGFSQLDMQDPWGLETVRVGDVVLLQRDIWTVGIAATVLLAFFGFFRYSPLGVAMRASALDQEAALAQGIGAGRVFGTAWGIAGVVAALAGVMLGAGPGNVSLDVGFVALLAFPAIILGGLDSPGGSVVGGLVIGLTQLYTAGYQSEWGWTRGLGNNFDAVMPFLVMIVVLMFRPYGLFGTRTVRRV